MEKVMNRDKFRRGVLGILVGSLMVYGASIANGIPYFVVIIIFAFSLIPLGNGTFKIIDSFRGRVRSGQQVPIHKIILHYYCQHCDEAAFQYLPNITEVGTAICPDCGDDMELEDNVEVL